MNTCTTCCDCGIRDLTGDLKSRFHPSREWLDEVSRFNHALFHNEMPERLLIPFPGEPVEGHGGKFDMEEQWRDPRKMFYELLCPMVAAARRGKGASVPRIRANLGVGFIPSVFGIQQLLFPDKMPWPQGHVSKADLIKLEVSDLEDVSEKGLVPYAREIYGLYLRELGTHEYSFIPDTQGVLDIAHLVRGDELFMDFYDDPPFVHHLMELCLQAYISVTKEMKKAIGEPLDSGNHGNLFLSNGGVRICMDTSVLCSRDILAQFEAPYLQRALEEFGGGFVHFCGYAPQITDILVDIPEVRGVNPNYMDNRPYDYESDMVKLQAAGKFFNGAPFKSADESLAHYFDRMLAPLSRAAGAAFTPRGPGVWDAGADAVEDEWNAALARVFA